MFFLIYISRTEDLQVKNKIIQKKNNKKQKISGSIEYWLGIAGKSETS